MVNLKINGIPVSVPEGSTILQAAKLANIRIPTLCYLKDINEIGACRICVVEVKGARSLVASCVYPLDRDGTEIMTHSPAVLKSRKLTLELLLSNHDKKCLSCVKNGECEFQKLCADYGVEDEYDVDDEAGEITIYGDPKSFGDIQKHLEENGFEVTGAEFTRIPNDLKDVTPEERETIEKMVDLLEDDDDVQNVYTNMKPE